MVSSKTTKSISLAISLLVLVISLTGVAQAATAPQVSNSPARFTPGFSGSPGKMATDAVGNLYVTDFWGKGIMKLNRNGEKIGFIPTAGRPTAVAVLSSGRLVVAMGSPRAYVAFYSQTGVAPNVSGEEIAEFTGALPQPLFRPSGIAVDENGYIYVLDSGDMGSSATVNVGCVRVYNAAGQYQYVFGTRTLPGGVSTTGGAFKYPSGIAYEKESKRIIVADTNNGRLQFFNQYSGGTCSYVTSIGSLAGTVYSTPATIDSTVRFSDPTEVALEYSGSTLNRIYVAERGLNEIKVVEPGTGIYRSKISAESVVGGRLKHPSGLVFQNTATGGVLYVTSAPQSTGANVVAFGIDSGSIPAQPISLAINSIPATSVVSPIALSGTVTPAYPVNCTVNGGSDNPATLTDTDWSVSSLPLVSGYNEIVCRATDGANTVYAAAYTKYDGAAPVGPGVTIASPLADFYTGNTTVVVSGTTPNAGNANVMLTNAKNGKTSSTVSGANKQWTATIELGEGANVITASAWRAGTQVDSANVTVTADYTPPNVASLFSFLADGAKTVNAVQNLDGIVVEKNLASITVNGEPVVATVALSATDTYYSVPVTLVRGSNTITVEAVDRAGKKGVFSRTVTLNPEIPGITVALPADNSYLNAPDTVTANGTAGTGFTDIDACGTAGSASAETWSVAAMSVPSGFNSCQFTATGGGNVAVSEKRTINVDDAYAKLAITSPAADLATSSASIVLTGEVAAGGSSPRPTISINNGAAVQVTGWDSGTGVFSHTVDLGLDGTTTTVKVMADGATTAVRSIIRDTTKPRMSIQASAATAPSVIAGALEPSAKLAAITAKLDGVYSSVPITDVTFTVPVTTAAEWSANLVGHSYDSISFTAVDPAGNETVRTFVTGIPTGDVDRDGAVRLSDAMACLRHVAATELLDGQPDEKAKARFQADVGSLVDGRAAQDGEVTVEDAVLILLKAYGLKSF